MRRITLSTALLCFAFGASAQTQTFPYDHVHLNVPDIPAAASWYEKYFGAKRLSEGPNRLMFGSSRFIFMQKADAKPSAGSAVDHIGFSVPDIDKKMKEFEAAGVKIVDPVRDVPGLFKLAFIEDPWGTRIEVVQDLELLGLHHIHMRSPYPDDVFTWMLAKFGGEHTKLKGRIEAIKYSSPGFSDLWVLVQRGDAEPTEGHAIDHMGFRSMGSLAKTMDELKTKNVIVTTEPTALSFPNGPGVNYSYVIGPAGARIEIVERPGLKPGE